MGLDNYPSPYPCELMRIARYDKEGKIDCEVTNCPFKKLNHVIGMMFGTYCWIRGKAYEFLVHVISNGKYTLYKECILVEELRKILNRLKESDFGHLPNKVIREEYRDYKDFSDEEIGYEKKYWVELVAYLETLLSIKEWVMHKDACLKGWW